MAHFVLQVAPVRTLQRKTARLFKELDKFGLDDIRKQQRAPHVSILAPKALPGPQDYGLYPNRMGIVGHHFGYFGSPGHLVGMGHWFPNSMLGTVSRDYLCPCLDLCFGIKGHILGTSGTWTLWSCWVLLDPSAFFSRRYHCLGSSCGRAST